VFIGGRDCKVVDLSHEDDSFALNQSRVEAWLVGCRGQPKFAKNGGGVFLPDLGLGVRVALHCGENRDHMSWWDRSFLRYCSHHLLNARSGRMKNPCLGGGSLGEGIADVGSKNEQIFGSQDGIE
jgi:hypothetical protein